MKRVLGIDPGLRITGYGLVTMPDHASSHRQAHASVERGYPMSEPSLVEAGVFRLDAKSSLEHRLDELYSELVSVIEELKPDVVAVEKLFAHYNHPRTAILMGHARGVILLAAKRYGLPVEHLPSTEVKKAITGYGRASKEQIQRSVQTQYRLAQPPSPPDVADAIAIATACARRMIMSML